MGLLERSGMDLKYFAGRMGKVKGGKGLSLEA